MISRAANEPVATGLAKNSRASRRNGVSAFASGSDFDRGAHAFASFSRTRGSSTEYRMSTIRLITTNISTVITR